MSNPNPITYLKPVDHDPFCITDIQLVIPAIQPQIEIFTSCLMGGEDSSRSYNESVSLRLSGNFHKPAMFRALQDLVQRHEALRSCFSADGLQVIIQRVLDLKIVFADCSEQTHDNQQKFINDFHDKDKRTAFDLLNGPLFRVAIFKLAEDEHYLTLSAHHIICDGWSFGIMMQELSKLYSAHVKGEKSMLEEPTRFSSYAIEQRKFSDSEEYNKIEKYWIDQYKNNIPVLSVPTDYSRPSRRTYSSQREDFKIDPELVSSIKRLGSDARCSFVTTLLTLFKLYLHHATKQDDIVVGLPAAAQQVTGNNALVGHCVNILPLRSKIDKNETFSQFLQNQKKVILDAYDHQLFTFSTLLQKVPVIRDASRIPLVPIVFNVDMGMDDGVAFEGLHHQYFSNPRAYETFEIFVNASCSAKKVTLEWSFNTQLFKPSTVRQMMIDFKDIVETVVKNPAITLKEITIKNKYAFGTEHSQGVKSGSYYPKDASVHELISEKARQYSKNVAVYFGGNEVTYHDLNETANQLASVLIQHGVEIGDIVGIAVERSEKMVIALLGIMKAGAAYLPVDPEFPKERIEFMLEDSSPKVLLISKKFKGVYQTKAKEIIIEDIWPQLKNFSNKDIKVDVKGSDLVYILYTSGSTGRPKGVKIAHHNLINFLYSFQKTLALSERDKVLGLTTLSFDISGLEIYLPLIGGASVNIISSSTAKDGNLLLEVLKSSRPTVVQATPATWQMLIEAGWSERLVLDTICSGGEALTKDLAHQLTKRSKNLYNFYGPTETTIWSTVKKLSVHDEIITIGHPIDNTQIYILDKDLLPVSRNSVGEIYIAGDGVAKGYLKRPELTLERFIDNPFSTAPGDKMYRTGDLGRMVANGEIECMGRVDQQIKIRGFRIEPGEIEQCLLERPDIKSAVVISREHRAGDQRLVAYIVLEDSRFPHKKFKKAVRTTDVHSIAPPPKLKVQASQTASWKESLRKTLPSYMIPNDFVVLKNLPLTPNGKIDRKALSHHELDLKEDLQNNDVAPRSNDERLLADIWSKLLNLDKVSMTDDFFEIGGHSLLAIQMVAQIEKKTGIRIPVSILIENPTIETLALKLRSDNKPFNLMSLVPIKASGNRIPIYFAHELSGRVLYLMKLAKHVHAEQPVYGLQARSWKGGPRFTTIEEMAAHYITEIIKHNPEGPYLLAGYSYGGLIAYEIAQQLKTMGKEVRMLAIFDTDVSHLNPSASRLNRWSKKISNAFMQMIFGIIIFLHDPRTKIRYEKEVHQNKLRIIYRKIKMRLQIGKKDKLYSIYEISRQNRIAEKNYKMLSYDGPINLFRCKKKVFYLDDFEYLGWRNYVKDIHLHDLPGDHDRLFSYPYYYTVAPVLQACIDKIDKTIVDKTKGVYPENFEMKVV